MHSNQTEWSRRGKETDPVSTTEKIISLLQAAGFETEYRMLPQTVDICFASRVTLKEPPGNLIGANGKGLSADLCKASAYAELIERLQNEIFTAGPLPFDPRTEELNDPGEIGHYSIRGEDQPECIQKIKDRIIASIPDNIPRFAAKELVDSILEEISPGGKGLFYKREFFSLREKKAVFLPVSLIERFTLSNGMAAGNSLEEALVQGCSEVMERYCELVFLNGKTIPPDIPKDVLSSYPSVSHIIDRIEAGGRYRVIVKDCSLGKGLPVVCGIICDTKRQTFGVKFGAYPDLCVALERVFSESLQGYTLETFTANGWPLFNDTSSRINSWNLIKTGYGAFPSTLIMSTPDYPFRPWENLRGLSNRKLTHHMFSKLCELTPDVYIADVSFLGFPSVMIYAAGVSESIPVDFFTLKELKLQNDVQKAFHQAAPMDEEQLKRLAMLIRLKRSAVLENDYQSLSGNILQGDLPGAPYTAELLYAFTLYSLGEFENALAILNALQQNEKDLSDEEKLHVRTAKLYISAVCAGKSNDEIMDVMQKMCPQDVLERVSKELSDRKNAVWNSFPHCPGFSCDTCEHKNCVYPAVFMLYKKLKERNKANPVNSAMIEEIFSDESF